MALNNSKTGAIDFYLDKLYKFRNKPKQAYSYKNFNAL